MQTAEPGRLQGRIQLEQRVEHEEALGHPRMRNRESGLVDNPVAVEQDVHVDRPWPETRPVACPAQVALEVEQDLHQLARFQLGLHEDCAVEEAGLGLVPDRRRLTQRGHAYNRDPVVRAEALDRDPDRLLPVAEVGAEADIDIRHTPAMVAGMGRLGVFLGLLALLAPIPALAAPTAHVPTNRELEALGEYGHTMLGLRADDRAESTLVANGATVVDPELHIWRLSSQAARRLIPALRRSGVLRFAEPDRPLALTSHLPGLDPLAAPEIGWHLYRIGADRVEPPGPGVPLTVLDSGLDLNHMEFKARVPKPVELNRQEVELGEEYHGTIVASTAAAPADGQGGIGVYPQAVLRVFDLYYLSEANIVQGIRRAVATGPGVINLSLGGDEPSRGMYEAIVKAFARGSIVVAAAGNERGRGDPPIYPAGFPHVLTVGSTDVNDRPSDFSSTGPGVDLVAPGESIPWQDPTDPAVSNTVNGTSFSAPQVAAATAWVWTARRGIDKTQLFDLMRHSARDLEPAGFDRRTGLGMLDIPAALTRALPPVDPLEPNDDVDHVKPQGIFGNAARPLTAPGRRTAVLNARLHATEDPDDVYRFWVPAASVVTARIKPTADLSVAVWATGTRTVYERGQARRRDLLTASAKRGGRPETVRIENKRARGFYAYLDVFPAKRVRTARYSLSISSRALR